jgi:hypothetical protein
MKRIMLIAALILIGITGCKEKKEGLALFVIGDWRSQELTLYTLSEGIPPAVGCFSVSIRENDTYTITFDGAGLCGTGKYVTDGDKILLNSFSYDPVWGDPPGTGEFNIIWTPGETQMTWIDMAYILPDLILTKQ